MDGNLMNLHKRQFLRCLHFPCSAAYWFGGEDEPRGGCERSDRPDSRGGGAFEADTRDTHDRTYLYASNIAINQGRQQPVHFLLGEELRLTDANGQEMFVRIVDIVGRSALLEFRPVDETEGLA